MKTPGRTPQQWERLALALDLRLAGWTLVTIGDYFGVSKQRARQMVTIAARRLNYRVFGGKLYDQRFNRVRGSWQTRL